MDPYMLYYFQELFKRLGWLGEQQLRVERQLQAVEQQLLAVERQLQAMTRQLQGMSQKLADLEDQPTTHIDKIEYRFDQLKVDTLSGTLQIGLAHGAEGQIDELGVGAATAQDLKLGPLEQTELYPRVTTALNEYMSLELNQDIESSANQAGVPIDDELRSRIVEDLQKQVNNRVLVYIKEIPTKEGPDEAAGQAIVDKVKSDVRAGLKVFFDNYGKEQPS